MKNRPRPLQSQKGKYNITMKYWPLQSHFLKGRYNITNRPILSQSLKGKYNKIVIRTMKIV